MIVRILGSAAGGGVPQWNCACTNCAAARAGRQPFRTQSGVAISDDGDRWLLLNCSPDIAMQIERFTRLQPRGLRGTPIAGMLFTDANVDHLGGLAVLRQGGNHAFVIRSSNVTREIATSQPAFAPFTAAPHRWLDVPFASPICSEGADDYAAAAFRIRALDVPGTTPGYDGRRRVPGAVVAYEITPAGCERTLLFAPVFTAIDAELAAAIARADLAILDGSFYTDDELITQGLSDKHARALGHQPISGPDGTLARLPTTRARIIFTHINNSNPILNPTSNAAIGLREANAELAHDGMEFRVS